MRIRSVCYALGLLTGLALWPGPPALRHAAAVEFVVQTSIFDASTAPADKPVARNTTVFLGTVAYDQIGGEGGEVCYLDWEGKGIELLSPTRRMRTRVDLDELLRFVSAMQARAQASPKSNPLVRFAAAPQFELTSWDARRQFRLEGDWLEYAVRGKDYPSDMVTAYKEFADWCSRLNAARHPGALPPAARLELNKQIAQRGWIPTEVRLTIRNKETSSELLSRHSVSVVLRDEDRRMVQRIDRWRREFQQVDLREFGQLP